MKRLTFYIILFFPFLAMGQEKEGGIIFTNTSEILDIGKQVYFLEDKEGKLTIEDIQKPEYQEKFIKSTQDIPNFGTTSSKIWLQLTISNQTDENLYLEVANAQVWYIDFYKSNFEGKLILTAQTGLMRPVESRELYSNFFLFELPQNPQGQTHYISFQSDYPLAIPLHLGSKNSMMERSNLKSWFFGIFWGWVVVMIIYNIFLAYSTNGMAYWYYVGLLFMSLFVINFGTNLQNKWNFFSYFPEYFLTFLCIHQMFVAFFVGNLLHLPKTSSLYKVLVAWIVFLSILTGINLFTGKYVNLFDLLQIPTLIIYIYILFFSIYLLRNGHLAARFVIYGFSFYIVGVIVFILQNLGLITRNSFIENPVIIGHEIEIVMFSLALGDRMNQIRRQKIQAQKALFEKIQENEQILKGQNEVLEEKVQERTEDLQVMNEELNSTVEELSLTLEMLDNQKKTIETINRKTTSSINYALTIQTAILPSLDYLEQHLKEFALVYRPKDIVSGDFYWLYAFGDTRIIAVADCTGHGVAGAFTSLIGIDILNDLVKEKSNHLHEVSPSHILSYLSQGINERLKQGERQSFNEGMDIGICFIQEKGKDTFSIKFSGAKRPLYYKRTGDVQIQKISGNRKSIGTEIQNEQVFTDNRLVLQKGDTIYLCSDGFQDQNNPQRKKFGEGKLVELLNSLGGMEMVEQAAALEDALDAHQRGAEQRDDITLMGIRL